MKKVSGLAALIIFMMGYSFIPLLTESLHAGYSGFAGWVHNPFSPEMHIEGSSAYLLFSVAHYFLLLPVLLFFSVRAVLLYISDVPGSSKYFLVSGSAGAALGLYIILGLAFRAVTVHEYGNNEAKLTAAVRTEITGEALALDLNEVCWQTRFKMLKGEISPDFTLYKDREKELLKKIIGSSTYPVLRKIVISGITDSSITFEATAESEYNKMQARVFNTNSHVLLENVGIYKKDDGL